MTAAYWVATVAALGLSAYLVVVLLKPEWFE
jgi:K+-transporting ATPase KdpF subunit